MGGWGISELQPNVSKIPVISFLQDLSCTAWYISLTQKIFVYFEEKNRQKDEPGEGSAEDSDNENKDRNLGDTTDILNMVIYSTNESVSCCFCAGGQRR